MLDFEYVTEKSASLETVFAYNEVTELKASFLEAMGEELLFRNNHLTAIPLGDLLNKEAVRIIDFSQNKIKEIPHEIV
jgi:Leucine-rich repeat (LRR) protein